MKVRLYMDVYPGQKSGFCAYDVATNVPSHIRYALEFHIPDTAIPTAMVAPEVKVVE